MWLFRNNPYLIMHAFRLQSMYYKKNPVQKSTAKTTMFIV